MMVQSQTFASCSISSLRFCSVSAFMLSGTLSRRITVLHDTHTMAIYTANDAPLRALEVHGLFVDKVN